MKYRLWALVLLLAWSAVKFPWELRLERERNEIMYGTSTRMSFELRDSLGQGLTLAALGGFRGLAANFLWLSVTNAWEEQQWTRLRTAAEFAVMLQPRVSFFWENAAWHLAWNASVSAQEYDDQGRPILTRESMQWIHQGESLLKRGIDAIPEKPVLYQRLAELYWQRLKDYEQAAHYYDLAKDKKGAPTYIERFVGYGLENAGKKQEAYDYWCGLWRSSEEHSERLRRWDKIEEHIRNLEKELNIPLEKRIFPN